MNERSYAAPLIVILAITLPLGYVATYADLYDPQGPLEMRADGHCEVRHLPSRGAGGKDRLCSARSPGLATMNSSDLTHQQLELLTHKLQSRLEANGFPADDELLRLTQAAFDRVQHLHMTLHYLDCDAMRRR